MLQNQDWKKAINSFQRKHYEETLLQCQVILNRNKKHAYAWHLKGVVENHTGKVHSAINSINQAILIAPDQAEFRNTMGVVLLAIKRFKEAEIEFRTAIKLNSDYLDAGRNLVECLLLQKKYNSAETIIKQHIEKAPNDLGTLHQFARWLESDQQLTEAVKVYHRILENDPCDHKSLYSLGRLAESDKSFEQAITLYRKCLAIAPSNLDAILAVGLLLAKTSHPRAKLPLPEIRLRQSEAVLYLTRFTVAEDSAEAFYWLAIAYKRRGQVDDAIYAFQEAIRVDPQMADAFSELGLIEINLGNKEKSRKYFKEAVKFNPSHSQARYHLVASRGCQNNQAEIQEIQSILQEDHLTVDDRIHFHFSLAKLYEENSEFDSAFHEFSNANNFKKNGQSRYSISKENEYLETVSSVFNKEFFEQRRGWGSMSSRPIFIVGVPRSGTTLIEQILASHSEVYGAGELPDIPWMSQVLSAGDLKPYPLSIPQVKQEAVQKFANQYDRYLASMSKGANYVVDKLPGNTKHLGLIALLFPNCHIIHCERDPLDACVSGFRNNLDWPHCNLKAAGESYRHIKELMNFWNAILPVKIHQVSYEQFVESPESGTKSLLEFCGLPWEQNCLSFHETVRSVGTPSKLQVRQPIYQSSVGSWKKYESHLDQLKIALELKEQKNSELT